MAVKNFRDGNRDRVLVTEYNNLATLVNELRTWAGQVQTLLTELKTDHNGLATKLDADAGVTDTNYNSTQGITAATPTAVAGAAANTLARKW